MRVDCSLRRSGAGLVSGLFVFAAACARAQQWQLPAALGGRWRPAAARPSVGQRGWWRLRAKSSGQIWTRSRCLKLARKLGTTIEPRLWVKMWPQLRGNAQCVPSKLGPNLPHSSGPESGPRFQDKIGPMSRSELDQAQS